MVSGCTATMLGGFQCRGLPSPALFSPSLAWRNTFNMRKGCTEENDTSEEEEILYYFGLTL